MNKQIAVIGECMIELSQSGNVLHQNFGGDTLNTAVYLARQLDNSLFSVHYVTALGTDNFSEQMLNAWQSEQLQTQWVQRLADKLPGLYYIKTDAHGERQFYYWRNDAAARFWLETPQADSLCDALTYCAFLYLSGISLAILNAHSREKLFALLRRQRALGGKVIFDNNYRPRLWGDIASTRQTYLQMLACTDIAFLTLDDEQALWGEAIGTVQSVEQVIARSKQAGVDEIVIKRGAQSCLVVEGDAPQAEVPAQRVTVDKVVDTTAAGDSFSAGYLAIRLAGGTVQQAAQRGHLLASTVIQHTGAIIPRQAMPV